MGVVACGSRTGLLVGEAPPTDGGIGAPDGGSVARDAGDASDRACGPLPSTGITGFYNVQVCGPDVPCDDVGGANVCLCADAGARVCGFDAIHDDGHVFVAQCDLDTGKCDCVIDGNPCTCQGATSPVGLCSLNGTLNCCF
jgi:hypothetical protein